MKGAGEARGGVANANGWGTCWDGSEGGGGGGAGCCTCCCSKLELDRNDCMAGGLVGL